MTFSPSGGSPRAVCPITKVDQNHKRSVPAPDDPCSRSSPAPAVGLRLAGAIATFSTLNRELGRWYRFLPFTGAVLPGYVCVVPLLRAPSASRNCSLDAAPTQTCIPALVSVITGLYVGTTCALLHPKQRKEVDIVIGRHLRGTGGAIATATRARADTTMKTTTTDHI